MSINWSKQHRTRLNPRQMILTKPQWDKLVANRANNDKKSDAPPVVRFFAMCGSASWTVSEAEIIRDDDGQIVDIHCYGIGDIGMGPSLGYVSLTEMIETSRKGCRSQIERDLHFHPNGKPLSVLMEEAQRT